MILSNTGRQGFDTGGLCPYHARAMGNPLQDRRTAAELASVGQVIEIADKISSFESLVAVVEADLAALEPEKQPPGWRDSAVTGELQFGFVDSASKLPMVSGNATASVGAVCQRCLQPFQLRLEIEPRLLLLGSDETADGYDEFEVWELEEQMMRPQDVVEELFIMAMPLSATHDNTTDCKVLTSNGGDAEELVKPFAALRAQMTQNEENPAE
jgi:uncharacterized metal-binding protein YceD (DUF177 family)